MAKITDSFTLRYRDDLAPLVLVAITAALQWACYL